MKTLVVGAAIVDVMMNIERLPKSGEDVTCSAARSVIGGCAYNVARTLSNMDCECQLCVPVGTGMYGNLIEEQMKKDGYRVLIKDEQQDNGYCLSLVEDDGERSFITVKGLEGCFKPEWFEQIDMDEFDNIYVAGYQVCGESGHVIGNWLETQKDKNIYFAPGPVIRDIADDVMEQIMSVHPVVHLNDKEAFELARGENLEECLMGIFERNKNLVFVTLGEKGVMYFDGKEMNTVPSVKTSVADTVGAGDSHVAAIIGGRSKGMKTEDSVIYANRVAASIVGIQGPTMDKKEFERKVGGYHEHN